MCGITGFWVRRGDPDAWLADLPSAIDSLSQRGPDDHGSWVRPGGRVALGHTRLAILDLSPAGHQPMASADGALTLVFNGEVYNFAAIRAELEALGHRFTSSGDTEVVLAALGQWGIAAVDRFIGMFALAVWNERERRMLLLRDRLGVKPLYYAWNGDTLWFGSELKALRAFRAWPAEIDRDALAEYLQFGYISAPRSIYARVAKLMPGHWLEVGEVGEPVVRRYWSPVSREARSELENVSEAEAEERLEALMTDAFRYRMVSDVPVGVFLSGGIDSSTVAALLQHSGGGEVRTFTIGFADRRFDESAWARGVARHLGTRHVEQIVTPGDMGAVLERWGDLFDEPFGDSSGVPTYLVSVLARQHVKVALSADGGDELFHGYNHYRLVLAREAALRRVPRGARRLAWSAIAGLPPDYFQQLSERLPAGALRHAARRSLGERLDKLRVLLPDIERGRLYDLAMTSWTPWEIPALVGDCRTDRPFTASAFFGAPFATFADQMAHCDLRHFLPDDLLVKVDRTSMACGLEGREPFLDHRLVEFALRLPMKLRRGALGPKHLVRRILYRHVPRAILDRPKQGFAVPLSDWLRGELAPFVRRYLAPERIRAGGIFDPALIARAVENFTEGGPRNDRIDLQKIWYLIAFEMWRERWLEAPEAKRRAATPTAWTGERHASAVGHQ